MTTDKKRNLPRAEELRHELATLAALAALDANAARLQQRLTELGVEPTRARSSTQEC